MAITVKKAIPKRRKPAPGEHNVRPRAAKGRARTNSLAAADDLTQRRKIGKSLDQAAFIAHHKHNRGSAACWETQE